VSIEILIPVAIVLLVVGVFGAFFIGTLRKRKERAFAQALLASGRQAPATILQADAGSLLGSRGAGFRREFRLELEVRPADRSAFRVKATAYDAPAGDSIRPGQSLVVRYDPNDTSKVAVEPSSFRDACDAVNLEALLEQERLDEASKAR
jgi:hypothetical protein